MDASVKLTKSKNYYEKSIRFLDSYIHLLSCSPLNKTRNWISESRHDFTQIQYAIDTSLLYARVTEFNQ